MITKKLFNTLTNKKIGILGFAFKANTNDTRESAAIKICKDLLAEGAILYIHDPKVDPNQISKDLVNEKNINSKESINWFFSNEIEEVADGSDAILVLTEWAEYSKINWGNISKLMRHPAWIFDSRSIINPSEVKAHGLNLWRIGDGAN